MIEFDGNFALPLLRHPISSASAYLGLRGTFLNAALVRAVIMPAYLLFGYNNAVAGGGLPDLPVDAAAVVDGITKPIAVVMPAQG
ncbi:hypothetical protein B0H17DRAFT_1207987 [Mycena rosella]|uniref:Uncharacterized protein n=1 Tax=Mycena rosella TaxID=1033263 RepID=A0AAD7G7H5_MYCRO|nr:hypothetical protein B0H17DRAFT_1207987 [Mycena rosella]